MGVEILKKGGKVSRPAVDISTDDIVNAVLKKIELPDIDVDSIKEDIKKDIVTKEELEAVKTTVTNQAKAINRIDADLDVLGGTDE